MATISVRELALQVRSHTGASVSPQVLASIAAGNQKTCRRSVRDAIAQVAGWPVTGDWLSGAEQPTAVRHLSPGAYLETLQTSRQVVESLLTYERMRGGDYRHNDDYDATLAPGVDVHRDDDPEIITRSIKLALQVVGPMLTWSAWASVLSEFPYNPPTLDTLNDKLEGGAEKWSPGMYESILQEAFAHWGGTAIRVLLDNGAIPLNPKLVELVKDWVAKNLTPAFHRHLQSRADAGGIGNHASSTSPGNADEVAPELVVGVTLPEAPDSPTARLLAAQPPAQTTSADDAVAQDALDTVDAADDAARRSGAQRDEAARPPRASSRRRRAG